MADIETEIASALPEMAKVRNDAAKPLVFSDAAAAAQDERSREQFRGSLPLIKGGFATVRTGLLEASALFGTLAKELARFDDPSATEISAAQAQLARETAESACKLKVAKKLQKSVSLVKASDGIPCARST